MKQGTYFEGVTMGYKMGTKATEKWVFLFSIVWFISGCAVGFIGGATL